MIKKIWHDPVWSKVISQIIIWVLSGLGVLGLGFIILWFFGQWPNRDELLRQAILLAVSKSQVSNWFLTLLCIGTAWKFVDIAHKILFRPYRVQSKWESLTKTKIDGIVWRWNYNIHSEFDKESVQPYCPKCYYELAVYNVSSLTDPLVLKCNNCVRTIYGFKKYTASHFSHSIDAYLERIYLEIERKYGRYVKSNNRLSPPQHFTRSKK